MCGYEALAAKVTVAACLALAILAPAAAGVASGGDDVVPSSRRYAKPRHQRQQAGFLIQQQRQQAKYLQRKQQSQLSYLAGQSGVSSFFGHSVKCFSCMSKIYEAVWPALAPIYKRPLNFTDVCDTINSEAAAAAAAAAADESGGPAAAIEDGFTGGGARRLRPSGDVTTQHIADVPVVQCSTICVGMWEETNVAGVRIRAHIRGCMDDLLHAGFNETIVALFRWLQRDSCRNYRKRELLKLPPDDQPMRFTAGGGEDNSALHVCTCYADYCNAASATSAAIPQRFPFLSGIFGFLTLWLRYGAVLG